MRRGRERGMTLIEVLVASFVVAVGLSGFLLAFSSLTRTARATVAVTDALHAARTQTEQLRTRPYLSPEFQIGLHALSNGSYTVSNGPRAGTLDITVYQDVHWPNSSTSQISLTTTISSVLHK